MTQSKTTQRELGSSQTRSRKINPVSCCTVLLAFHCLCSWSLDILLYCTFDCLFVCLFVWVGGCLFEYPSLSGFVRSVFLASFVYSFLFSWFCCLPSLLPFFLSYFMRFPSYLTGFFILVLFACRLVCLIPSFWQPFPCMDWLRACCLPLCASQ